MCSHYIYLDLSLDRSEGNLFQFNIVAGDIFNSENTVVGENTIRTIFKWWYEFGHGIICEVSHGEELEYTVTILDSAMRRFRSPVSW